VREQPLEVLFRFHLHPRSVTGAAALQTASIG
jgi:hypothetical protein